MADFSPKQRHNLANKDMAMPDGSYPIRNKSDLKRAVQAYGRAKNPEATKLWICKRAKELNAMDLVPEEWWKEKGITHMADDSELVTVDSVEDFLKHYGVLGMHWGIRKDVNGPSRANDRANIYRTRIEELRAKKPFNRAQRLAINAEITALAIKEKQARNTAALGRKSRAAAAARDAKLSEDHKISRERLQKKTRELSNKEIRETNDRLQMEKKLSELRQENRKIQKGRKRVENSLKVVGTAAAVYAATQTPFGKLLISKGASYIKALRVFAK